MCTCDVWLLPVYCTFECEINKYIIIMIIIIIIIIARGVIVLPLHLAWAPHRKSYVNKDALKVSCLTLTVHAGLADLELLKWVVYNHKTSQSKCFLFEDSIFLECFHSVKWTQIRLHSCQHNFFNQTSNSHCSNSATILAARLSVGSRTSGQQLNGHHRSRVRVTHHFNFPFEIVQVNLFLLLLISFFSLASFASLATTTAILRFLHFQVTVFAVDGVVHCLVLKRTKK